MRLLLLIALVCLAALPAYAVNPDEVLDDPVLEARAREISTGLRCLVCQNQSIDDSDAPLARDLRLLVRERLVAGDTNGEIVDFVVARYGEFVLLQPRFNARTLLLWLAPLLLLGLGMVLALGVFRGRRETGTPQPLDADEESRLRALLDEGSGGKS